MDSTSAMSRVIGVIFVYFIWVLSKKRYNFMKDPPTPKGILSKGILPFRDPGPRTISAGTILPGPFWVRPFLPEPFW